MDQPFVSYVIMLAVLVVGLIIVKKVTTCMIKAFVGIVMLAIVAFVYWLYFT